LIHSGKSEKNSFTFSTLNIKYILDEAKKTLQEDLIRADNEFTAHIQQQEAYHQRLAIAEQKVDEIFIFQFPMKDFEKQTFQESEVISFLDSHQSLSELISRVRNLTDEIKSKEKAVEPVRPSLLSKDEKLAEVLTKRF